MYISLAPILLTLFIHRFDRSASTEVPLDIVPKEDTLCLRQNGSSSTRTVLKIC